LCRFRGKAIWWLLARTGPDSPESHRPQEDGRVNRMKLGIEPDVDGLNTWFDGFTEKPKAVKELKWHKAPSNTPEFWRSTIHRNFFPASNLFLRPYPIFAL